MLPQKTRQPLITTGIPAALNESILASSEVHGVSNLLVAQTPVSKMAMPGQMKLLRKERRKERKESGPKTSAVLGRWPKAKQVALPYPYFCFVFKGEADIHVDDAIISCPANHGILIPRGTPLSDGSTPHWERPPSEDTYSDILWLLVRPFGAECHLCHTRGERHFGGSYGERTLISNRRLFQLTEMLIDEMTLRLPGHEEVAASYWQALLKLLIRHLESGESLPHQTMLSDAGEFGETVRGPDSAVQRAQRYIVENLGKSLTLEEIAHASFVSRAQLARLFQEKTGSTVWQYVTERRLDEAKSLLVETDISIFNIARLIGFPHASYFCTRFAQLNGCPPNEFRRRAQEKKAENGV